MEALAPIPPGTQKDPTRCLVHRSHPIVPYQGQQGLVSFPTSVSPQVSGLVIPAQTLEPDSTPTCRRPLLAASFLQSSGVN